MSFRHRGEACALWGLRRARLSRTLPGTSSREHGRPARPAALRILFDGGAWARRPGNAGVSPAQASSPLSSSFPRKRESMRPGNGVPREGAGVPPASIGGGRVVPFAGGTPAHGSGMDSRFRGNDGNGGTPAHVSGGDPAIPYAGGTRAFPGACARGMPGENPTAHMLRPCRRLSTPTDSRPGIDAHRSSWERRPGDAGVSPARGRSPRKKMRTGRPRTGRAWIPAFAGMTGPAGRPCTSQAAVLPSHLQARHERPQDAAPAQAAPWGEIRRNAPRTDSKPRNNAVSVGVKNISTPSLHPLYQ